MPGEPSLRILLLAASAMLVATQLAGLDGLGWSRTLLQQGEAWRWLTGHWVHLGYRHLLLNLAGLWLLAWLFETELDWRRWLSALFVLPVLISAGFWWGLPSLQGYAGLSGVLHGVFVMGIVLMMAARTERRAGIFMLLLLVGKFGLEWTGSGTGQTADWIGGPVLVEAHWLGAAGGLALGVLDRIWRRGKA